MNALMNALMCAYHVCLSEAYLEGPLGHGPLLAKIFFWHWEQIGKLGWPLLCMSTSGQPKFAPPFQNPKYATGAYKYLAVIEKTTL